MPSIPGNDPAVLALQGAARDLQRRGATDERIHNYVSQALAAPRMLLPAVFTATHPTGGLPGFPAVDIFAPPGTLVLAPEDCDLVFPHRITWNKTQRVGGWTCYLRTPTATYFDTHLGTMGPARHYKRGEVIGTVGKVPNDWWPAHIHHGKHKGPYDPGV